MVGGSPQEAVRNEEAKMTESREIWAGKPPGLAEWWRGGGEGGKGYREARVLCWGPWDGEGEMRKLQSQNPHLLIYRWGN